MLMRLFNSSDKHSLQKIRSQHLIQINLVVDLLVDELMLSSSHRFVSVFNVNFLISIVNVLSSDAELLLLLSFALSFAKRGEKKRIKRLFIFLFIEIFPRFKLLTSKNSLNIA